MASPPAAFQQPPPHTVRPNTQRLTRTQMAELAESTPIDSTPLLPDLATLAAAAPASFTPEEAESLTSWRVPNLSADGSCASGKGGLAPHPFDVCSVLGPRDTPLLRRLWALREAMRAVSTVTGAQWAGVYRVLSPAPPVSLPTYPADAVLMKEAYVGAPSRPFFPLTPAFAEASNNATVGLSGCAILIDDTRRLDGATPYYVCDGAVRAELCAPIFGRAKRRAGRAGGGGGAAAQTASAIAGIASEAAAAGSADDGGEEEHDDEVIGIIDVEVCGG